MPTNTCSSGRRVKRALAAIAVATAVSFPIAGHAAGLLSGEYAGTAINSQFFRPPFGDFNGSPVVGTFLIDLTGCVVSPVPVPFPGGCLASAASFLNATIPDQSNGYGQPETLLQVFNTPSTQRLSISFGYTAPYGSAQLDLVGGANAFIDGTDYSSLHVGRVDLAHSTLTLSGGRSYTAGVALGSLAFDQAAAGVPDAPTWAMLLAGFAMTGVATRVRTRHVRVAK